MASDRTPGSSLTWIETTPLRSPSALATRDHIEISIGARGVVKYSEVDHNRIDDAVMRIAEQWRDLKIRPDPEHG